MGHPTDIFVSEPSTGFICAICHDVLKDASTFRECGHTFCDECITAVQAVTNTCPNCRRAVTGSNPNYALREIAETMLVMCPEWKSSDAGRKRKRGGGNEDQDHPDHAAKATAGCEWKGQLKDLKGHDSECGFKMITCNVYGCKHKCQRQNMASHHSSPAGIMMHAELRHTECQRQNMASLKAMELRYENKIKTMEAKYESAIEQMESRYDYNTANMKFAMMRREQEYETKLEKKLKVDIEELEKNMYTRISERGLDSWSRKGSTKVEEQVSIAGYGGGRSLNNAVFQYIKNEGASDDSGVHVNDITVDVSLSHGVFADDIQAAITHLLNEGRICYTIDNCNYRIAARGLSNDVIQFIKSANADAGSHANEIIRGVAAQGYSTAAMVRDEIGHLSNEGHIYSTIDEFHYSAFDN